MPNHSNSYGYAGKILRVDLNRGEFNAEPTEKYAKDWIGGTWKYFGGAYDFDKIRLVRKIDGRWKCLYVFSKMMYATKKYDIHFKKEHKVNPPFEVLDNGEQRKSF